MIVVLNSADFHIERTENRDTGAPFSENLHPLGAVLEHCKARKAVAHDDLPLGRGAAQFIDDRFAKHAPA